MDLSMKFKIIDIQEDTNLNCYSVLTVVRIPDFIQFINDIHEQKGNLEEQREVLKIRSAKIIRNQMVEDLQKGAILPPIVLGCMTNSEINEDNFFTLIEEQKQDISILDGMQRIQALKEAIKEDHINHNLRVEFWLTQDESALLYRMLILNCGQIRWELDKQLEVVFKPILKKWRYDIPHLDNLIAKNLYKQSEIVQLFLAFTARRIKIKTQEQLAEYHAALDIMSLIREKSGATIDKFEDIFSIMIEIDHLLSEIEDRYIFTTHIIRVSFIVACAEKIFGLLGSNLEKEHERVEDNFQDTMIKLNKLRDQIKSQSIYENRQFLALDILTEKIQFLPKIKHGQAFLDAFKVIFSEPEINSFAVCWNKMY
ncbi:hypothetical protein PN450_10045 [Dolichospermum lemmermannii CS-548]|jgi:hypothetical protein|uniref:hypothetical protein n=1 Tax=Dolichospermum TaxID=748770 RepID=UPI001FF022F4|nr:MULTISPECIES: hypothetical protein [Dolichospermum]MDB9437134.1 hypothetical protein [Dolichospermum lemmermannii CS-548]